MTQAHFRSVRRAPVFFVAAWGAFALLAALPTSSAYAEPMLQAAGTVNDPLNELESGSRSALTFGSGVGTSFALGAAYSRLLMEGVQGTGDLSFSTTDRTVGRVTSLTLKVGPTINFSLTNSGIRDSFYVRMLAGIGVNWNSTSGTTRSGADFAYTVEVGKRFELFPSVFWKPAFNMTGTTATGDNPLFAVIPAQFSFFF